jgi:hypothetical protein
VVPAMSLTLLPLGKNLTTKPVDKRSVGASLPRDITS